MENFANDYSKEVCKLYLKITNKYDFSGICFRYLPRMLFIFDIDHTLTTENLYERLFENMRNRRVKEKVNLLKRLFLKLVCEHENKGWGELLNQELIETRMNKEDYLEAREKTVKEAKLTPGALQAKNELTEMGFTIALNSGEPIDLVQEFAIEKLSLPATFCFGSTFEWDEKGYFRGMRHNLGYNKLEATQNISKMFGCSSDLCIYSTDIDSTEEIGIEEPLFARGGLGLFVGIPRKGEKETSYNLPKYPNILYFGDASLKEDLSKITNIVKSWLVGRLTTLFVDPFSYYNLCLSLSEIKRLKSTLDSLDKEVMKNGIQKLIQNTKFIGKSLEFRYSELDSKLQDMLEMLERSKEENQKNIIDDICNEMEAKIPEWHFTEDDIEKIKRYAENFKR
jgi:phosphoserine phosphatase